MTDLARHDSQEEVAREKYKITLLTMTENHNKHVKTNPLTLKGQRC